MTSTRQWRWWWWLSSCRCLCIVVLLDEAKIYLVHNADNEMTTTAMAMTARAMVTVEVKKMTWQRQLSSSRFQCIVVLDEVKIRCICSRRPRWGQQWWRWWRLRQWKWVEVKKVTTTMVTATLLEQGAKYYWVVIVMAVVTRRRSWLGTSMLPMTMTIQQRSVQRDIQNGWGRRGWRWRSKAFSWDRGGDVSISINWTSTREAINCMVWNRAI